MRFDQCKYTVRPEGLRYATDYPGIQMIPVFSTGSEANLRELCTSFDKPFPEDALFRF